MEPKEETMDTKKETMESREETVEECPKKKSGVNLKVVALIGMIALIAGVFGVAGQFTGKGIGGQGADGSGEEIRLHHS